jgi:exosome complex RNA-binding protein Rrp42 (RNase PH superfamily)
MGGYGDVQLLRDDGLRLDGRKLDEMRPVTIEAGFSRLLMALQW